MGKTIALFAAFACIGAALGATAASSSDYVFYAAWQENCDPGHLTDSYNFTRCNVANSLFVNCVEIYSFPAQVDGVLYTVGDVVVDSEEQQLYYRLTSQTTTNVITRSQVYKMGFDGSDNALVVDLDVTNFKSCKGCIIRGMALSPSEGIGALYFVMNTTIYYCPGVRTLSSPCTSPLVLYTNTSWLDISMLQLVMENSTIPGLGLGTLYFSGDTRDGNSTVGWPGFLRSVDVKEFAGLAIATDQRAHGDHTDLSEFQLDPDTGALYVVTKIQNDLVSRLVKTTVNGASESPLDAQSYYSYSALLVKPLATLYWFNQWVINYRQVGMNIVAVPTAGQASNTSTTYAAQWCVRIIVVVCVRSCTFCCCAL